MGLIFSRIPNHLLCCLSPHPLFFVQSKWWIWVYCSTTQNNGVWVAARCYQLVECQILCMTATWFEKNRCHSTNLCKFLHGFFEKWKVDSNQYIKYLHTNP